MIHRTEPDFLQPPDPAGMVMIASGKADTITRWADRLMRAALPCAVARPYSALGSAELWVGRGDADLARALLGMRW